ALGAGELAEHRPELLRRGRDRGRETGHGRQTRRPGEAAMIGQTGCGRLKRRQNRPARPDLDEQDDEDQPERHGLRPRPAWPEEDPGTEERDDDRHLALQSTMATPTRPVRKRARPATAATR